MATKTENLQLWKWAKTDPVDVEQINDNFGKVDTYLGKNGALEKVAEFTVQSAAAEVDFDLNRLDFSQYRVLTLILDLKFSDAGETRPNILYNDGTKLYEALVDNASSTSFDTEMGIIVNTSQGSSGIAACIEMYRCQDSIVALHQAIGKFINADKMSCCLKNVMLPEIALEQLVKITITTTEKPNNLAAGSTLVIYGVKR